MKWSHLLNTLTTELIHCKLQLSTVLNLMYGGGVSLSVAPKASTTASGCSGTTRGRGTSWTAGDDDNNDNDSNNNNDNNEINDYIKHNHNSHNNCWYYD